MAVIFDLIYLGTGTARLAIRARLTEAVDSCTYHPATGLVRTVLRRGRQGWVCAGSMAPARFAVTRAHVERHVARLGTTRRRLLLSLAMGMLVSSVFVWLVDTRLTHVTLEQAAARAVDQVELGVRDRVAREDFDPPFTSARLDDLNARLDPVLRRVRQDGSDIIRLNIVARDGTVLYSDVSDVRGRMVEPGEKRILAIALGGGIGSERSNLDSTENADLKSLYGEAIEVYVPVRLDDVVVGAYEVYTGAWPSSLSAVVLWLAIASAITGLTYAAAPTLVAPPPKHALAPRAARGPSATRLTPRELQVLRLLATTHSYQEIANELIISEETVRTHVKNILRKLGQPDRTQAVVAAFRMGILEVPHSSR